MNLSNDPRLASALAVAGGGVALAAAFFFQYVLNLPPCPLCIEQRWAHAGAIALGALSALVIGRASLHRGALFLSGAAYLYGAGLALYHAGIEQKWWPGPASCTGGATPTTIEDLRRALASAPIVLCDKIPWSFLGISMAGYNALYSAALALLIFVAVIQGAKRR